MNLRTSLIIMNIMLAIFLIVGVSDNISAISRIDKKLTEIIQTLYDVKGFCQ